MFCYFLLFLVGPASETSMLQATKRSFRNLWTKCYSVSIDLIPKVHAGYTGVDMCVFICLGISTHYTKINNYKTK